MVLVGDGKTAPDTQPCSVALNNELHTDTPNASPNRRAQYNHFPVRMILPTLPQQ